MPPKVHLKIHKDFQRKINKILTSFLFSDQYFFELSHHCKCKSMDSKVLLISFVYNETTRQKNG